MEKLKDDPSFKQLQADLSDLRIKLTNIEEESKEKKRWINPVTVSIIIPVIGFLVTLLITNKQQKNNLALEKEKLKSSLILKALDAGDEEAVSRTLLWYIDKKLFEDKDSLITKAALNPSTLPINDTSSNNNLDSNRFNTDPQDLPTLMVTNVSKDKNENCGSQPGAGCWNTVVAADAGDTIAVQVYIHNSTPYRADSTTLSIQPQISQKGTFHTFAGGVASLTLKRSVANATVITTSEQTLSFIPGSLRMYKNGSPNAYQVSKPDDLFKMQGLNIGNVSPGWQNQGTLVAFYVVSK